MNTLEKLIQKLCPEGVEYRPLGEVCGFGNGYTPSKSCSEYWTDGDVPWFRLEDIRVNGRVLTDSIQHITKAAVKGSLFPASSLIVSTSATIGEYALVLVPALTNQRFTALSVKSEFASKIDIGFLKHMGYEIGEYCKGNINQGNFASVDMKAFRKFMFPLPPLSVQKEIVRMLDDMAGLIDALEEELVARKKQYEWYRDRLLRIKGEEDCYKLTLGGVCEVLDNMRVPVSKKDRKTGPYPYYGANGIQDYVDSYIFDGTFLLVGEDGSVINEDGSPVLNWVQGKVWVNNHAHVLKETDKADLRYLFYLLQTNDISAMVRGTPPKLNQENLKRITVNLPTLSEQRRIVKILDNFDTLCNSMTEGLPGEIALRKQQYEYYRDKVLAFKRKPEVA